MREDPRDGMSKLNEVKHQLARLAYDITSIRYNGNRGKLEITPFESLETEWKAAYVEGVWAAVEASKGKNVIQTDSISLKEQDNGYLVYAGCKELKKLHPLLTTYSKFPEPVKESYRQLAEKVHEKMEMDEET
jgi:hypothetical protein